MRCALSVGISCFGGFGYGIRRTGRTRKGTASLVISLCRYTVVILPIAVVRCRIMGANGVWHAFWVTELYLGRSCIGRLEASVTALTPRPRGGQEG